MPNEEKRHRSDKRSHKGGERHEKKRPHEFEPTGPGYTRQSRTGQRSGVEPPRKGPFSQPGYTPQARTEQEEEEQARSGEQTKLGPPGAKEGIQQGTFINIRTGEVRTYFANPPQTDDWQLLSPRLDITLEEARQLVKQGGYGSLKPEQVHF